MKQLAVREFHEAKKIHALQVPVDIYNSAVVQLHPPVVVSCASVLAPPPKAKVVPFPSLWVMGIRWQVVY